MEKTIPNLNSIINITHTLSDIMSSYDVSSMEILFRVDRKTLNNINEDIFYRNNPNSKSSPEETDEIIVNINGFKIKYVLNDE